MIAATTTRKVPHDLPAAIAWTEKVRRTTRTLRRVEGTIAGAMAIGLIAAPFASEESPPALVMTNGLALLVGSLAMIFGYYYLVVWMNRACALVPLLGNRPRPYSLGSIVGGFLIPIISFFRPYQVMRAIDGSFDPNELPAPVLERPEGGYREPAKVVADAKPVPAALVSGWWASFVIAGICSLVSNGANKKFDENAPLYDIVFKIAVIASALFTFVVVGQVQARIDERLRRAQSLAN